MRVRAMLALAAMGTACPAWAAQDSDSMLVTATVIASCEITASDLDFLDYDPISPTPRDVSTTIGITCTNGSDYDVLIDAGAGVGATIAARRMTSSAGALTYSLYRNTLRTQLWGDTIDTDTVPGVGTGALQTLTVYGRIPAQQTVQAEDYADTVTVTVNY